MSENEDTKPAVEPTAWPGETFDPAAARGLDHLNGGWPDLSRFEVDSWHGDDPPEKNTDLHSFSDGDDTAGPRYHDDTFPEAESPATFGRPTTLPPLAHDIIDPTDWHGQSVPERRWLVPGLIPVGTVTMLSGDGGLGKSLLALQLLTACALTREDRPAKWLGREVMECPAFGLFCEDSRDELHRRLADVLRAQGAEFAELVGRLHLMSQAEGQENALMTWEAAWLPGEPTALYGRLMNHALDSGHRLIVLDSLHDVFSGNEINRQHARQFISSLRTIATEIDGAVLLTAHPSLTGRNTGTGESGSTAWNNAVRSRLYLARDPEDRDKLSLKTMKANYSAAGEEIALRWREGVLEPLETLGGVPGSIQRGNAETAFLECLAAVTAEGRYVHEARQSGNYAPALFAGRPEAQGFKRDDFKRAMERLFQSGRIKVAPYTKPNRHRGERIIAVEQAAPGAPTCPVSP